MSRLDELCTRQSNAPFDDVIARLRDVIHERGLTLFAEIDHAKNAHEVGLTMPKLACSFSEARKAARR